MLGLRRIAVGVVCVSVAGGMAVGGGAGAAPAAPEVRAASVDAAAQGRRCPKGYVRKRVRTGGRVVNRCVKRKGGGSTPATLDGRYVGNSQYSNITAVVSGKGKTIALTVPFFDPDNGYVSTCPLTPKTYTFAIGQSVDTTMTTRPFGKEGIKGIVRPAANGNGFRFGISAVLGGLDAYDPNNSCSHAVVDASGFLDKAR